MKSNNSTINRFFLVLLSVIFLINIAGCGSLPDKQQMEEYFTQNEKDILFIAEYLKNSNYSDISIKQEFVKSDLMFTGVETRYQIIENKSALEAVKRLLLKKDWFMIEKNDNTIYFAKAYFIEEERGIAFSLDDQKPDGIQYLTELEPLSKPGWYYYVSDYEKYRNQRTSKIKKYYR